MPIGTGHLATLTFNSAAIANVVEITNYEETSPEVDATHLETTGTRAYEPADLGEMAPITARLWFDTQTDLLALGSEATLDVTFPLKGSEVTAAKLSGTAHVAGRKYPDFLTNTMMEATLTFRWKNKPTFTAGADT